MSEELSPHIRHRLDQYYKAAMKRGLSTQPINRKRFERAVRAIYEKSGFAQPAEFVYLDSPAACVEYYNKVTESKDKVFPSYFSGNQYIYWIAYYLFGYKLLTDEEKQNTRESYKILKIWQNQTLGHWWFPFDTCVLASENPTILAQDDQNRLHSLTGPAIAYKDGYKIYASHGVQVPAQVIEAPETMTVKQIENEENAEVRRVMIEQYGQAKFLKDAGAVRIATDDFGTLWKKDLKDDPEPIVMVELLNSTPEADGHQKVYFIRVPPNMKTPYEALKWMHNIPEDKAYKPAIET